MTGLLRKWPSLAAAPRFVQARDWRWLNRTHVRLIVMHTAECSESKGAASAVAHWFATHRPTAASSHLVIDNTEIWECVRPEHEAFGARGGDANLQGYHIELCGRAAQGVVGWEDPYSKAQLGLAAKACAVIAGWYGVPVQCLTADQVRCGATGFCGHMHVSTAYAVPGGHVDPGPDFPWSAFLESVKGARVALTEPTP